MAAMQVARLSRNKAALLTLRSITTPRTSLPFISQRSIPSRPFSRCLIRHNDSTAQKDYLPLSKPSGDEATSTSETIAGLDRPKLSLTFTCTVTGCGERSTHQFTKHAYEKGIVIIQCPKCQNRHLIADHLGWFKDSTEEGKLRTVEDILRAKGEKVQRGVINDKGDIEFVE